MRHAWIVAGLLGCSSSSALDDVLPAEVSLLVGQESDTWSREPHASRLKIELVQQSDGARSPLIEAATPQPKDVDPKADPPRLTLPEQHFTRPMFASFAVTASDASSTPVVRGTSVVYKLYGIHSVIIPIFLGRVGAFSRSPGTLEHPHLRPVVGVALHEYLIAAGGDPVASADPKVPDFYDVAFWQVLRSQPPLPSTPKSMVFGGSQALFINDEETAAWLDLSNDQTGTIAAPKGLSFAEVAGGETFELPSGVRFIVGGTRASGEPTDKVLRIENKNGKAELTALKLTTPRFGAAAAVVGTSLVVAGGSETGQMAEVIGADQTMFAGLALPPDATAGLGLAALDATTAVAAGGKNAMGEPAAVRKFDIACEASCATDEIATLPIALTRTKVFSIAPDQLLVAGESDDGENHAFVVDATGSLLPEERRLKQPRRGATAALLPNGQVGLVGGEAVAGGDLTVGDPVRSIEAFIP